MIDYRVLIDESTGSSTFTILESSVVSTQYTATGLTQGSFYLFSVEARNAEGLSFYSNVVAILAAQIPAQPDPPLTTWYKETDEVTVTWVAPDNGGSAITGYKLSFR